ncbi:MAG: PLP-dependent aspartate aminotransferase family protein [Synergistaceae bacterium]|jgi:methionine-gamma-lyase|nr:PLP-dependent aspartate aminotransferase family protein [Synergistaceae bacterium]
MVGHEEYGFATRAIHEGQGNNPYGALATPIYMTSTFCFENVDDGMKKFSKEKPGFVYGRSGNPTTAALEAKCAAIEEGEAAVATSSGMGAISSVFMSLLKKGDHLIAGDTLYGGSDFAAHHLPEYGIEVTRVDTCDPAKVSVAFRTNTRIVYIESSLNPTLRINDICALADITHERGAILVVDNTFTPPPMCFPLRLGADIVLHSTTKYLNGHGDIIGGVVVGPADMIGSIRLIGLTKICGCPASPMNSWLVLRGMKTLDLRFRKHCENAMTVAKWLETQPEAESVFYPGLPSHPQHELSRRQFMEGLFGGMVSFEVKKPAGMNRFEATEKVMNSLKLFAVAVSLGDPDSLAEFPAGMTHLIVPKEEREAVGITDGLIRLSCGLEDAKDLCGDLKQALAAIR